MPIAVTTPSPIGPGYLCHVTGLAGPVPADDFFQVGLRVLGMGGFLTAGVALCRGSTAVDVILGVSDVFVVADGLDAYVAPGALVQAEWTQFHANFAIVASGTITGLLWDPTGGAYQLIQRALSSNGGLSDVLAAVRRTYP